RFCFFLLRKREGRRRSTLSPNLKTLPISPTTILLQNSLYTIRVTPASHHRVTSVSLHRTLLALHQLGDGTWMSLHRRTWDGTETCTCSIDACPDDHAL